MADANSPPVTLKRGLKNRHSSAGKRHPRSRCWRWTSRGRRESCYCAPARLSTCRFMPERCLRRYRV